MRYMPLFLLSLVSTLSPIFSAEQKTEYREYPSECTDFVRAHVVGSHIIAAATQTNIALYIVTTDKNIKLTHLQTSDNKPDIRVALDQPVIKNFVINRNNSKQIALVQRMEEDASLSNLCLYEGAWEKFRSVTPQFKSVADLCFLPESNNLYTAVTKDNGTHEIVVMSSEDLRLIPLENLQSEQGTRLAAATQQALAYSTRSGPHYVDTTGGIIKRKLAFTDLIDDNDSRPIPLDMNSDGTSIVSTNRNKVFIFDSRAQKPKVLTDENLDITNLAILDEFHLLLQNSHPVNPFTTIYDQRKGGHVQDITATFDYASLIQNGRLVLSGHDKPIVLLQR